MRQEGDELQITEKVLVYPEKILFFFSFFSFQQFVRRCFSNRVCLFLRDIHNKQREVAWFPFKCKFSLESCLFLCA